MRGVRNFASPTPRTGSSASGGFFKWEGEKTKLVLPALPINRAGEGRKAPLPRVHGRRRVERSTDAGETSSQRSRNQPADSAETIAQTQAKRIRAEAFASEQRLNNATRTEGRKPPWPV